jgi:hypothetical protein
MRLLATLRFGRAGVDDALRLLAHGVQKIGSVGLQRRQRHQ